MNTVPKIIVVCLNPCMDKTIEISGFSLESTNRVSESRTDIGGKGINVARVLNGCGVPFVATGLVAGTLGRKLVDHLEGMGVQTAFCETDGETRTNLKILDTITGKITEINEKGFLAGNAFQDFREALMLFLPSAEVLVLSGSVPTDIGDSIYRELTALGNSLGVKVILDADGTYLQKGIEAKPYAIKPNLAEFESLVGHKMENEAQIIEEAKKLNATGISLVAVSLGEEGAIFVRDSLVARTRPFPVEVKSASAAGDSMVAMLAYATSQNLTLTETAKLMTAAGTLTAAKVGTTLTDFSEILAHKEDVPIEIFDIYNT